jgi:hypothetical protein
MPQRELINMIQGAGLVPTDADLQQLLRAVRRQSVNYAIDTGTANSIIVAYAPTIENHTPGLILRVKIAANNTGHTIITTGAGSVTVRRPSGTDLLANDIIAGGIATLVYDGAGFFQLVNFQAGTPSGTINTYTVKIPWCIDTSTTANTVTAPFTPAITAASEGDFICVRIANNNTGVTNIGVNALPAVPIRKQDGTDLFPRDIVAGEELLMCYRGTYWQIIGPVFGSRPHLIANMGASQLIPGNTPTLIQLMTTIIESTLVNSTWDGRTFTCGTGEDGLWFWRLFITYGQVWDSSNNNAFVYAIRRRSGAPDNGFIVGFSPASQFAGQELISWGAGMCELLAGDTVNFYTSIYSAAATSRYLGPLGPWWSGPPGSFDAPLYGYRLAR